MGNFRSKNSRYRALSPSSETDCSALSVASNPVVGKRLSRLEFPLPPPKSASLVNFAVPDTSFPLKNVLQPSALNSNRRTCQSLSSSVTPNVGLQIDSGTDKVEKDMRRNDTRPARYQSLCVAADRNDSSPCNNHNNSAAAAAVTTPSTSYPGNKGHQPQRSRSMRMPPSSEQHRWVWKLYDTDNDGHLSEPDMRQMARTIKDAFYSQTTNPLGNTHSGYKVELKITKIKSPSDEWKPARNMLRIPEEGPAIFNPPRKDLLHPVGVGKSVSRNRPSIKKEHLVRLVEESHARNNIPIKCDPLVNYGRNNVKPRRRPHPSVAETADLVIRHDHVHHFPEGSRKMTLI